uniref:Myosin phosphatase Rho-interacting protein-like n=1 Tax=Gouania willdenowi TaxID=441366 RepID=A0A8C5EWY0_GOUWI
MSTAKENPCRKFQANFFNKSKCQNCFKPRELHLLTDQDLTQAKPIYGGWLCLAPEGTDFDNPMQRSRKWQRRFFVLYEHGCLRFALDESPSTLPQGTVNMNLCSDVIDAEPKTGQKNSLCIITPDQEYFIRGENKEIINGWSEQLIIYPRTNKQNQKKKRKVEPATSQEPGPAKVAVTGSGIPEAEKTPDSSSIIWQEELNQREAEGAAIWSTADLPPGSPLSAPGSDTGSVNGDEVDRAALALHAAVPQPHSDLLSPTGSCSSLGGVPRCISPAPSDPFPSGSSLLSNGSHISGSVSSLDSDASGSTVTSTDSHPTNQRGGSHHYSHHDTPRSRRLEAESRKAGKRSRFRSPERQEREAVLRMLWGGCPCVFYSRSGVIEKLEALELENQEKMEVEESGRETARQGRSEHRRFHREVRSVCVCTCVPLYNTCVKLKAQGPNPPDLLNFKKGWMVKLDEQGQWKKYWFVLTDHSLRYYKDSIAEEASDLDGEIDLSTCYSVTEHQAQRNYGFQIHTQEGVHTLSAMTAGIRRNWIQAVMKNVRPSTAPDVDSPSTEASSVERESAPNVTKSRARERRREGRSKTFDWAEFRPIAQALAQQRAQEAECFQSDVGELDSSQRRDEQRKMYETVTSSEQSLDKGGRTECDGGESGGHTEPTGLVNAERQQMVEEVIEEHWRQVEKTPIRDERRVPLPTAVHTRETAELSQLLESYKHGVTVCLPCCLLMNCLVPFSKLEHPLGLEADVTPQTKRPELVSPQAQSLTKKYQETKELLKLQELKKRSMQAQLGLTLSHLPDKEPYFSDPQKASTLKVPSSEPVQKTVTVLLEDSAEAILELEDLINDKPLSLKELQKVLKFHSCNRESVENIQLQKLLDTWKYQQEVENEMLRKSLARAGDSIRDYEARLLTMEDLMGQVQKQSPKSPFGPLSTLENHSDTSDVTIGMLSQRLEFLTSENEALQQRCQEIVNQLTEADREIDRLKAELSSQPGSKQHQLALEELKRVRAELTENQANAIDREYYERELNEKSLRLHEALVTLEELGSTLKDTEKKLQLKEATLKGLGFQADYEDEDPEKEQLAMTSETEARLHSAEQRCTSLQLKIDELVLLNQELERVGREKLAEKEIRMLEEKVKMKSSTVDENGVQCVKAGDEQVKARSPLEQVVKECERRSEAIDQVVEMLAKADKNVDRMLEGLKCTLFGSKEELINVNRKDERLVLEGEFWSQLMTVSEREENCLVSEMAKQMVAEMSLMLWLGINYPQTKAEDDLRSFPSLYNWLDDETNALILKLSTENLQEKSDNLKQMASILMQNKDERLLSLANACFGPYRQQIPSSEYLLQSLTEASLTYVINRVNVQHEKELNQTQTGPGCCVNCPNCLTFRDVTFSLQTEMTDLQNQPSLKTAIMAPALTQTDEGPLESLEESIKLQDIMQRHKNELVEVKDRYEQDNQRLRRELAKATEIQLRSNENVKEIESLTTCIENLKKQHDEERADLLERFNQEKEELRTMMSPVNGDRIRPAKDTPLQQAFVHSTTLKERVQELVTQVLVMTEEMRRREELGDATTLRLKYEKDLENLKATCERGFAAMEESHQKVIDELQRKHQRELENLQEEKERLLEEETAATISAIEAMKNAHRTELEKEVDRARKTNSGAENADVEEIHRQHEEELCSFQREIEVLSEQYSQKCLENAHLAQALEAERQALRQCQRENQELNAHNQELNNRLAAEITKMRSMTSEDGTGDAAITIQGKELYELEVMLRVKESEVQYLKQEINSLKDELQSAQRDKKYATDKYKDIYTELSIFKAKAERDLGRLREQLQLAHEALGEPSLEEMERGGYDIMKSKSNPDILRMAAAAAKRSERTMRSKVGFRDSSLLSINHNVIALTAALLTRPSCVSVG